MARQKDISHGNVPSSDSIKILTKEFTYNGYLLTMAAAILTITTALQGFSLSLISYHTLYGKRYRQNHYYQNYCCPHTTAPFPEMRELLFAGRNNR